MRTSTIFGGGRAAMILALLVPMALVGCDSDTISPVGDAGTGGGGGSGGGELCGDGKLQDAESCDTAIASGEDSCPTSCAVSSNACSPLVLVGEGCDTQCAVQVITDFVDADGCCPTGGTGDNDSDCAPVCGDGQVSGAEACDTAITDGPGACPTSCTGVDACSPSVLSGEGCAATCVVQPITLPTHGDTCCPLGADATNDDDCTATCGNSVLEPGEACDGASCPTSCTATDACNPSVLVGSTATCDATCEVTSISACADGDGCCADGCTTANDDDCSASCGDGVLDAGEACDSGIASGPGACPTSCNDGVACTNDVLAGSAANCTAACAFSPVTTVGANDGCCPAGGTNNNDVDCAVTCGNGVTESGETCDAACPTSCTPSGNACAPNVLVNGGTCTAACQQQSITTPANGDGCCPAGATYATDTDCPGVCGNSTTEPPGETCDDGNPYEFDGCFDCQTADPEATCISQAEANRGETGPCIECMCAGTADSCRDELDRCYNSTDIATDGPAAGQPKSELCAAVIVCGRESGCSGTECYDFGDGPCAAQIEAAAEHTGALTILARKSNLNYAVGRANAISECATDRCETQCL